MMHHMIHANRETAPAGEYRLLHKHLQDRFADRVVLSFSQIEDLLGFALPGVARSEPAWWDLNDAAGQRTVQSSAWTLAGRHASANMAAQHVTFDRDEEKKG